MHSAVSPQLGDRLRVWRGVYWHYGMYLSNGSVIEHAGMQRGGVQIVPVATFSRGSPVEVLPHLAIRFTRAQAVQRALSRLGDRFFHLFKWNCEHFVNDAAYGNAFSSQAKNVEGVIVMGGLVGAFALLTTFSPRKARATRW